MVYLKKCDDVLKFWLIARVEKLHQYWLMKIN